DSPATTSTVFYTICSNAMSGGQAGDALTVNLEALGSGGGSGGGGGGGSESLQAAYNVGNVITASDSADLQFNLADTATDPNFLVNLQCTSSCGSNGRFAVQNSSVDVFSIAPNSGAAIFQNSSDSSGALQVLNQSGKGVLDVDTAAGQIDLGTSGTGGVNGSIVFNNAAGSGTATITLA